MRLKIRADHGASTRPREARAVRPVVGVDYCVMPHNVKHRRADLWCTCGVPRLPAGQFEGELAGDRSTAFGPGRQLRGPSRLGLAGGGLYLVCAVALSRCLSVVALAAATKLDHASVQWLYRAVVVRIPVVVGELRDDPVEARHGRSRDMAAVGQDRPTHVLGAPGVVSEPS